MIPSNPKSVAKPHEQNPELEHDRHHRWERSWRLAAYDERIASADVQEVEVEGVGVLNQDHRGCDAEHPKDEREDPDSRGLEPHRLIHAVHGVRGVAIPVLVAGVSHLHRRLRNGIRRVVFGQVKGGLFHFVSHDSRHSAGTGAPIASGASSCASMACMSGCAPGRFPLTSAIAIIGIQRTKRRNRVKNKPNVPR